MSGSERPETLHSAGSSPEHDDARKTLTVRSATAKDLQEFFGALPGSSMRAIVGVLEDKVVGIAGTFVSGVQVMAFCELRPEIRHHRKAMIKAIPLFRKMLSRYGIVFAQANPREPSADRFLRKVGFEYYGPSEHGEVYIWVTGTKR